MSIIFWSPNHGIGTSLNMSAVSTLIALKYSIHTLILSSHFDKSDLSYGFFEKMGSKALLNYEDTGIDAIERTSISKRLTPELLKTYSKTLIMGRLDILENTEQKNQQLFDRLSLLIRSILEVADNTYNLILCDVNSGNRNELTNIMLKSSDLVVVNLSQNMQMLKGFFTQQEDSWHPALENKKYVILLSQYDRHSKYSVKYIKKHFGYGGSIHTIPYNTKFKDMYNDHNLIKFFFGAVNSGGENQFFIDEIMKIADALVLPFFDAKNIRNPLYKPRKAGVLNFF